MSEVGTQLVENERRRREALREAKYAQVELLVTTGCSADEQLAELDLDRATALLQRIGTQKALMRLLLRERAALQAASAT